VREAAGNVRREETLKRQLLCVCVCVRVCSTGYRGGKRKQCVHVSENCRPPRPSLSLSLSQTHTHTYTHTHTHTHTLTRRAHTHTQRSQDCVVQAAAVGSNVYIGDNCIISRR
jgi:hypothetical protein